MKHAEPDRIIQLSQALKAAKEIIAKQQQEIIGYQQRLEQEELLPAEELSVNDDDDIVGSSPLILEVMRSVALVAASNSTVLILGETGTGKELIASAIHHASSRKHKAMVKLNCASIPSNLAESELFGHEKGSFTGALDRRIGKFELADNGTLFLDEIAELPLELQGKLLRALQEKEIERLGGQQVIPTDARIIAATNFDLLKAVQEGRFRSDLFYRLNVFPIQLPPLSARKEDIEQLSCHFLRKLAMKSATKPKQLSKTALKMLMAHDWPGNIRELEHVIERSVLLTKTAVIKEIALPDARGSMPAADQGSNIKTIAENERCHILTVLKCCGGKISGPAGAAKILGVPATTLNSKLKKLNISRKHILR
ncbi:Sigma-54 interaction domain-containing protein [Pedobacter steynii]|uniref:Sigma-54 interaction domain-containing protein n=1 Tax=Pedobacter steynii TaxID=430522 RepID=A0A1G9UYV3_9SPHI|nr:sigma-54 dependent transcriptional regulator [Pedobacter steynii]NQX40917.1 sigma-54-dependent Fis family transcriptional regulator [Pedobacter steynii]SDM64825.1 Sigma-54 interaction domain-containing protein [Pedobacter steynii]